MNAFPDEKDWPRFGPYETRRFDSRTDLGIVKEWTRAHGVDFRPDWLSPFGAFALRAGRPVALAFVYLPVGAGVAFVDFLYSAPGQSPAQVTDAMRVVTGALQAMAAGNGYSLLLTSAPRAIARQAVLLGWQPMARDLVSLWLPTSGGPDSSLPAPDDEGE